MKEATKRSIFRWIHIVFSIPILGYIYDSPDGYSKLRWTIRYVVLPVIAPFGTCGCGKATLFDGFFRRD